MKRPMKYLFAIGMPAALSLSALVGVGLSSGTALAASNCTLTGSQLQATSNPAYDIDANGYNLGGGTLSITDTGCASNFTVTTATASTTGGEPTAYPSLFYGCHWGTCSTGTGLPLAVSSVETPGTVVTTDATSFSSSGSTMDDSYDIWFNPSQTTTNNSTGKEMMIWLDRAGSPAPNPGGGEIPNVSIGGNVYNVWDNSGTVTFQFATPQDTVTNLDLGPLTSYAVAQGYLPATDYLIDVEAGFELWSRGSGVAVNNFAVGVKGTTAITVPNEVGRTDLNTAEAAITAAGLVPVAAGDSGVGNKGSVTSESPAAGSVVATGSTVTLTYTVKS
jgi:Glycosyl hydrolase family 12/PASTA domain